MSTIIITVDPDEPDRLFAGAVGAMRQSLDVSADQLARASGIGRLRIETIENGDTATRAERDDITVALAWLSNKRVAKGNGDEGSG